MKAIVIALFLAAGAGASVEARAEKALIVSFDGKGTAMSWDVGVMKGLLSRLKPDDFAAIYSAGSSSGSILASYFACHGYSAASVAALEGAAARFPKDVLDEQTNLKSIQLTLGVPPETSLDPLLPILKFATDDWTCMPAAPLILVTTNLDVADGRVAMPFAGTAGRTFDQGTYVLAENGRALGKICTYFVNTAMAAILADVKPEERLCDLRLLRTPDDLKLAILASIAEPTYYVPVTEPQPELVTSTFPVPAGRRYGGGFIMNSVVQDLKRARPQAYTVGTGRSTYTRIQNRIIKTWFTFPMNEALLDQRWWFDAQVPLSLATWDKLYDKKVTAADQVGMGEAAALACLASGGCVPELFTTPAQARDAQGHSLDGLRFRGMKAVIGG